MHNEETKSSGYDIVYLGGQNESYIFETQNEIVYEVKFKRSTYLFENDPEISPNTYEFVIEVAQNLAGKRPPLDSKIPQTIANIFHDFFTNHERIIVYICDSSDQKELARNRKFNTWFDNYKGIDFWKLDTTLQDDDGIVYYTSLIIRKDNPLKLRIIAAFEELPRKYAEEK